MTKKCQEVKFWGGCTKGLSSPMGKLYAHHAYNYRTSASCCPNNLKLFKYIVLYLFDRLIVYLIDPKLWLNCFCNIDLQICDIKLVMLLFYIIWFGNVVSTRIMALWRVIQKVLQEKYIFKLLLKLNYNGKETILGIKSY